MDHTIALIEKSHNGDKEAREQLVEENIGLIWCVVKRFYGRGIDLLNASIIENRHTIGHR